MLHNLTMYIFFFHKQKLQQVYLDKNFLTIASVFTKIELQKGMKYNKSTATKVQGALCQSFDLCFSLIVMNIPYPDAMNI